MLAELLNFQGAKPCLGVGSFSKLFDIKKTQYELDFVDIDPEADMPLFLDPYYISKCEFPFAENAYESICSYFEYLLALLKGKRIDWSVVVMADVAASVLAKLRNKAKASGISYQQCLQLFVQEEFLRKLSKSGCEDTLILKGGLFIYTLTN